LGRVSKDLEEYRLDEVFGFDSVAQDAQRYIQYQTMIAVKEDSECIIITIL
jgi:hypothetical protein